MVDQVELPGGLVWAERPFPDANFLLLTGDRPALIDSGFASHAEQTAALATQGREPIQAVVNTHWHSDHVGGNQLLQQAGAEIISSPHDAGALSRVDAGCCVAEYLDQPVPQYTVDTAAGDGDRLLLGRSEWQVIAIPGHTPGHLALWEPEQRTLVVGDSMSSYDVGWVSIMSEGVEALDTAIASVTRLRELDARTILPGHGPLITTDADAAVDKAIDRLTRQREHLDRAVAYGAKRVLAFQLMIRDGIAATELEPYLHQRAWARDAATMLEVSIEEFARDLVDSMVSAGAITNDHGILRAAAPYTEADPSVFDLPWPKDWTSTT